MATSPAANSCDSNPIPRKRLRALPSGVDALVVEHGLAASAGEYSLNVAHWPGCTSLLEADAAVLEGYKIARCTRCLSR
jgi:hypothetical protein